ncbi:hypothetical protein MUCCIDRAFT_113608 [Mucor lusitanicus CBS 277.49]|uniref:Uncharacterized protein n=1 Tax=Mucor lusitanicus CBS 277.49 TaxID=747725 RepID=A0A168INI6_MUCCL|nr:hypothetical protein MUCCIDRAFT_113608 [Mucor lusitanicus CBS 277.49]
MTLTTPFLLKKNFFTDASSLHLVPYLCSRSITAGPPQRPCDHSLQRSSKETMPRLIKYVGGTDDDDVAAAATGIDADAAGSVNAVGPADVPEGTEFVWIV